MNTETTMSRRDYTIALFRDNGSAQDAIRDLHKDGFRADQIGYALGDSSAAGIEREADHKSFWQKVESFFGAGEDRAEERDELNLSDDATGDELTIPDSYRERLRSGSILVAVLAGARRADASSILTKNGGDLQTDFNQNVAPAATAGGVAASRVASADLNRNPGRADLNRPDLNRADLNRSDRELDRGDRIQLLSERLRVNKEKVSAGEARLRKEVVTEQQTVKVPVSHEELVVERVPVSGNVAAQGKVGSGPEVRVPLSAERVTVDKQPVVREEVRVGKKTVQETQEVSDSVRHEELKVDDVKRGKDALGDRDTNDPLRRKSA